MRISLDQEKYYQKPLIKDVKILSGRIAKQIHLVDDIRSIADRIGNHGQTWCPATFSKGKRSVDTFEQMQFFALDFDNGVSWDEIYTKSTKFNIPILFAYETFSSVNRNKFRVVFLNDISIPDKRIAKAMIQALMFVFEGCDKLCKDVSRMFFGGKGLFYFDDKQPTIDIGSLFMNMCLYIKNRNGVSHYTRELERFAKNTGITYNPNTHLGVFVHTKTPKSGDNSPNSIILTNENGEKSPLYYQIIFGDISKSRDNSQRNHKPYRSDMIDSIREQCRLFREFESDTEWLYYGAMYGLALNLIHVEYGTDCFLNIVNKSEHSSYRDKDWSFYLSYSYKKNYLPMNCDSFCPYAGECEHGANILETAKVKYHAIVKLKNTDDEYCKLNEAEDDLARQFDKAMQASDNNIHVVKAQTAIGKTKLYINYMVKSNKPCLIAVPTNKLKDEVYERAFYSGINVKKTPSILDYYCNIPCEISERIQLLFDTGRSHLVTKYIESVLEIEDIPALSRFLKDKAELKKFKGHIITTHHYLLLQSNEYLKNYTVIIDEDILETIISNQCVVSIDDLCGALAGKETMPSTVRSKIEQAVAYYGSEEFFTISRLDYESNLNTTFNLSAFLRADKFYSDGKNIYFLKNVSLVNLKYVVLSATVNENIYNYFFGADRVSFYNCRTAKYKGRLIQYGDKSTSRTFFIKNQDHYDIIRGILGDSVPMITFKDSSYCSDIHFGNSEGCDHMKGKDIAVVGTPHIAEFVYKLFAHQMGFLISKDDNLQYQEVSHGGYKFWFFTYNKTILRDIQFWLIESELEQSVGRARLLRCDCRVSLFSNFPLPQAELKVWNDFINSTLPLELSA